MSPRFSILTTAYRTEAYLDSTIASVRAQTIPDWEMIVVDNGMSDGIAAIVQRHADEDPRITLIRQENRGYAGGVNTAAKYADGEYLCPLDSDDQYLPRFLASVTERLCAEPSLDAVCVDVVRFRDSDDFDALVGYRTVPSRKPHLELHDVLSGRVPHTTAIRRDVWTRVGGLETDPTIEADILLWSTLAASYRVGVIHKRLARVREHSDSESRDSTRIVAFEARMIRSFELASRRSQRSKERDLVATAIEEVRYHAALRRAREAFLAGDVDDARKGAREALSHGRTVRALAVYVLLRGPQPVLRLLYRVKRKTSSVGRSAAGRLSTRWRARRDGTA